MSGREAYEQEVVELSKTRFVRDYLALWEIEISGAFALDSIGRRVLIGLTADETLEFLRLPTVFYGGDPSRPELERHKVLRRKFDDGREKAWREKYQRQLGQR
jgi:hypothetical protein